MPDQRSVMKEYRHLEAKRLSEGLTPDEEARHSRLRDLAGTAAGAAAPGVPAAGAGGFDVGAAAAQLRESLLPAGHDAGFDPAAAPPYDPNLGFDPAGFGAGAPPDAPPAGWDPQSWNPGAPLDPAADGAAAYDPNAYADPGAQAYDPNAYPADPGAQPYDPNAYAADPGAQPYDPNAYAADPGAHPYDPNAYAADPGAQPYDPNAYAADPGAQPYDPNAYAADPGAQPYDPNAYAADPGAQPYDPNAQTGWDANQGWDPAAEPNPDAGTPEAAAAGERADLDFVHAEPLDGGDGGGAPALHADVAALPPAGWDAEEPRPGPATGTPLGEYDETGGGLALQEDAGFSPDLPFDAAAPEGPGAPAGSAPVQLGEYDDLAPFTGTLPTADVPGDPSGFQAANGVSPEDGAAWQPDAALDRFQLASDGSFGGEDPAAFANEGAEPLDPAAFEPPAPDPAAPAPELDWSQPDFSAGDAALVEGADPAAHLDDPPESPADAPALDASLADGPPDDPSAEASPGEATSLFAITRDPPASAPDLEEDPRLQPPAAEGPAGAEPDPGGADLDALQVDVDEDALAEDAAAATALAAGVAAADAALLDFDVDTAVEEAPTVEGADILEALPGEGAAPPRSLEFGPIVPGVPADAAASPGAEDPPPEPAAAAVEGPPPGDAPPEAEAEADAAEVTISQVIPPPLALRAPPPAPAPEAADPPAPPPPFPVPGTHRVVVHTLEGLVKRGVLEDADLAAAALALSVQPGAPAESVPTEKVKAIFFMLAPGEKAPAAGGSKVRVTFRDGRQIAGFSPGYAETGVGFFVIPGDTRTNTGRIWVYRAAVRQVAVS